MTPPAPAAGVSLGRDDRTVCPVQLTGPARIAGPLFTRWSSELPSGELVVETVAGSGRTRLAYADPATQDRVGGILIARFTDAPGQGYPLFGQVSPYRQQTAMQNQACLGCMEPADLTDFGLLWLLPEPAAAPRGWPEGAVVEYPPTCLPCALDAVRRCPELRHDHIGVRVARTRPWGVAGGLYRPDGDKPVLRGRGTFRFTSPVEELDWVLATHQLRTLHGCVPVSLTAERGDRSPPPAPPSLSLTP